MIFFSNKWVWLKLLSFKRAFHNKSVTHLTPLKVLDYLKCSKFINKTIIFDRSRVNTSLLDNFFCVLLSLVIGEVTSLNKGQFRKKYVIVFKWQTWFLETWFDFFVVNWSLIILIEKWLDSPWENIKAGISFDLRFPLKKTGFRNGFVGYAFHKSDKRIASCWFHWIFWNPKLCKKARDIIKFE